MKKLAISLIVGASLVFTSSAFALQAMSTDNMKDATAQAGVSIAIDNVIVETWVGATTYTDGDGNMNSEIAPGAAGSISITDRHSLVKYNAFGFAGGAYFTGTTHPGDLVQNDNTDRIFDATVSQVGHHVGDTYGNPVTIDVGVCDTLSLANGLNGNAGFITGVVIGLPTLEISTTGDTYSVSASNAAPGAFNNNAQFITITTTGKTQQIYGGNIEIAPH